MKSKRSGNHYRRPADAPRSREARHTRRAKSRGNLIRRRWPRRILITANVFVGVCILVAGSAYGYAQWRLDQVHRVKVPHLTATAPPAEAAPKPGSPAIPPLKSPPFNVLIVGSDTRADLTDGQDFGEADTGGQRSDTIILARIAPQTHQVMLLSIPRDLWVSIPGQGENRINTAFNTSADLLVQTIQNDLHIPINHYVEVNFDTFRAVSNAVGGVSFYFPTAARDTLSGLTIGQPGCATLKGDSALAFVRSRHYEYLTASGWQPEAASDLARIQRQQAFIKKLLNKAESEFTNPFALNSVIASVTKNLKVDSGMSNSMILSLAQTLRSVDPSTIPTLTLPNYGYVTSGGADVLGVQQPQANQTIAAFEAFGTGASTIPPPSPSAGPTTTTTIPTPPSSVRVAVTNGTGTTGDAAALGQTLSELGYKVTVPAENPVSDPTQAPTAGLAQTRILYAPDAQAAGEQLVGRIPGGATTALSATLTPTPYNLEVVTGASYIAGTPVPTTVAPPTTVPRPSTTTTTIPGTNPSNYVLPGQPQGVPVPNC